MRGSDDNFISHSNRPGSKSDAARRFLDSLTRLKRSRRMFYRSEAGDLAHELQDLLADIKDASPDPKTGLQLLAKFYEADGKIIEQCDDSDGVVGDVFLIDAQQLFDAYATACNDKKWLCGIILKLCAGNDYGVRDHILDASGLYFPADLLRQLADTFVRLGKRELKAHTDDSRHNYRASHYLLLAETVAQQLKDPGLFEQIRLLNREGGCAGWLDIADAYLKAGDAETALDRAGRESTTNPLTATSRDELLLKIHQARGDHKAMTEAAGRLFHAKRTRDNFERLIELVGETERARILQEEAACIQRNTAFELRDAIFLADMGETAIAEAYIFKHAAQLDGQEYYALPPLAEQLTEAGHPLGAAVIYRALLEANLAPSISKYYRYGVRYLRELDRIAPAVSDWGAFQPHSEYLAALRSKHGRKSRFWELYAKSARRG